MKLEPVPVLGVLRELWSMPRDMKRFEAYLAKVTGGGEVFVPLIAANPMARPHMIQFVDKLQALGADRILSEACAEAERRLTRCDLARKVSLVPIDDVGGAWSERTLMDFDNRFGVRKAKKDYGYSVALVFVSEPVDAALLRERILAAVYRAAWTKRHGPPETVRAMMLQEGNALRFAGARGPTVPDPEAARAVLAPHLDATLHATRFAAMYGDAAAERVGHKPLGLPEKAGLAVALREAMGTRERPEDLV